MSANWLTPEEVLELTGYKRSSRQKRALAEMNIRFISRPLDGFPLVSRSVLALTSNPRKTKASQEDDYASA